MKTFLRLALPPLRELTADTLLPFVLLERDGRMLRQGELPLAELATALSPRSIQAILHGDDTVHVSVLVPPLTGARMQAAIAAVVEPLTLSAPENLAIAHSARQLDGHATLVWADRDALSRVWQLFAQVGLERVQFYPRALLVPTDPAAEQHARATDPALEGDAGAPDDVWQHAVPDWSLNPPALRPAASRASHWRAPLLWAGAASALWLVGLNIHAARVGRESQDLRASMQRQVAQAFPDIAVVLDPLKQATQRRDALRAAQGTVSDSDAIPLALATAQLLPDTRNRVQTLHYEDGVLTLDLEEDEAPTAPDARPIEQAAARGLLLARTETGWRMERIKAGAGNAGANEANRTGRLRIRQGGQP